MLDLNGESKKVRLIVASSDGNTVDLDSQNKLLTAINNAKDPFMPVSVESITKNISFSISATVWVASDRHPQLMEQYIVNALQTEFKFDNRQFGQGVAIGEVYATIQGVDGVVGVKINSLLSDEGDPLNSNQSISCDARSYFVTGPK